MLISTDWIKDFVELPNETPKAIGERVTLATAEVEEVLTSKEHLKKITIVEIKSLRKHPEADKLNLVTFALNDKGDTKEVVCGAPNVREGLRVPYAKIGVTLPNGLTLEPKKIRGFLSEGMLCSAVELGLGEDASGLMELPADAPLGLTMLEHLKEKEDVILDIDNKSLTHRPDLWGHYGFAREFSAIWEKPLKNPFDKTWQGILESKFNQIPSPISPKVHESAGLCYWGLSVDGVKVETSPKWMQDRLIACGLRPINSIVDISNFVMLELGIPNHIFDRSKIADNKIEIKELGKEDTFTTLDEIERKLVATDTVICDAHKPLVIAGIMGGANSGVSDKTTNIFIEVANWKAAPIRRTSTRLGLRTDSSQRYEKTLDSKLCYRTLLRVLELVLKLNPDASIIGKAEYDGDDLSQYKPLIIETCATTISKQLGKKIEVPELKSLLTSLDFKVRENDDKLSVEVPSYRATKDIDCEADIIEEVGRIIGYDNIAEVSPLATIKPIRLSIAKTLHRKIQDFMVLNARSLEVMTYPLLGEALLKKASWPELNKDLTLVNAISVDQSRMRPSLIPQILEVVSLNQKNHSSFSFFELGRTYFSFGNERSVLSFVKFSKSENCFLESINKIEDLLRATNIPGDLSEYNERFKNPHLPDEWNGAHPNEVLNIRIMGKNHGTIFTVHPIMLRKFKIKGHLTISLIDLTDIESRELKHKVTYKPLPKFPSSTFDCTVVCKSNEPVGNVLTALTKVKIKERIDAKVVTIFDLGDGEKSVTLRSTFFNPNETLSGEIIKSFEDKTVAGLITAGFPLKS